MINEDRIENKLKIPSWIILRERLVVIMKL